MPTNVVVDLLRGEMAGKRGPFLLNGFPRALDQADALPALGTVKVRGVRELISPHLGNPYRNRK